MLTGQVIPSFSDIVPESSERLLAAMSNLPGGGFQRQV
jgi:hypothetical protein